VIVYFALRQKLVRSPGQVFTNIVLPALGVCSTAVLWINLSPDSFHYGLVWFFLGVAVVLGLTRFFQRPLRMSLEEGPLPEVESESEPAV
jgi:putrescine importer